MNQRIQELVVESAKYADYYAMLSDLPEKEIFSVKLTELIIRECADLFEVEYGQSKVSGNEVAHVLKDHFGVEE